MTLVRRHFIFNRVMKKLGCFTWVIDRRFKSGNVRSRLHPLAQSEREEDDRTRASGKMPVRLSYKHGKKTYLLMEPLKPYPRPLLESASLPLSSNKEQRPTTHPTPSSVRKPTVDKTLPLRGEKSVKAKLEVTGNDSVPHTAYISATIPKTSQDQIEKSLECGDLTSELSVVEKGIAVKPGIKEQTLQNVNVGSPVSNTDVPKEQKTLKAYKMLQSYNVDIHSILKAPYVGRKPVWPRGVSMSDMGIGGSQYNMAVPSVSHILNTTMPPAAAAGLARWEETMIAKLGKDGFRLHRNAVLQRGRDFHHLIQRKLLNDNSSFHDKETDTSVEACYQSVQNVLKDISNTYAVESHVIHPNLQYRGALDCITEYKGHPTVIEWKHSQKKKGDIYSTFDNPVQLMSYLGALNFDNHYPYQIADCALVIAYTDGSPADVYELSSNEKDKFWKLWLQRLKLFWEHQSQVAELDQVCSHLPAEGQQIDSKQQLEFSSHLLPVELKPSSQFSSELNENSDGQSCEKAVQMDTSKNLSFMSESSGNLPDIGMKQLLSETKSNTLNSDGNRNHNSKVSEDSTENIKEADKGFLNKLWKIWKS